MASRFKPRGYGYKPDLPDFRDFYYQPDPTVVVGPSVDLRSGFPLPPFDQGNLGSCTANAVAGLIGFDEQKQGNPTMWMPSRLFQYYNSRLLEGSVKEDSGATIRDAIKAYAKYGACDEAKLKYVITNFKKKPSAPLYKAAKKHKPIKYERVDQTALLLKAALAAGFPIDFGFTVYESFESGDVASTGVVPLPLSDEQVLGGHSVLICGYDDNAQRFLCRNSWGTGWGQAGYFTMPFDYVLNGDLAEDFWIVRQINS